MLKPLRWQEFLGTYKLREEPYDERHGCQCLSAACLNPVLKDGEAVLTPNGRCIPGFPHRNGFTHLACADFWVNVVPEDDDILY